MVARLTGALTNNQIPRKAAAGLVASALTDDGTTVASSRPIVETLTQASLVRRYNTLGIPQGSTTNRYLLIAPLSIIGEESGDVIRATIEGTIYGRRTSSSSVARNSITATIRYTSRTPSASTAQFTASLTIGGASPGTSADLGRFVTLTLVSDGRSWLALDTETSGTTAALDQAIFSGIYWVNDATIQAEGLTWRTVEQVASVTEYVPEDQRDFPFKHYGNILAKGRIVAAGTDPATAPAAGTITAGGGVLRAAGQIVSYSTAVDSIQTAGGVTVASDNWLYLGAATTDGTWRIGRDGNNLVHQRRESGTYITKATVTP